MTTNQNKADNETTAALLAVVRKLVDEVHPTSRQHLTISLDSSFDRELGLDSLTRLELLARVEKLFNVSLPERVLAAVATPRDLQNAIQTCGPGPAVTPVALQQPLPIDKKGVPHPHEAATLFQVLQHHAEHNSDRPHIRLYSDADEGEVITYGDLWQQASRLAAGLQSFGLAAGESVLIMLPTGRDYFISFAGVLLAGGVPVPVYPPGRLKQIEEHLQRHAAIAANSLTRIMITIPEAMTFARLMHQQVESLNKVATVAEMLTAGRDRTLHPPVLTTNSTAFLQYTSGSTGMPKGVVLSHGNLLANIRAMGRAIDISSEDVFVSWLPLYHDMGLIGAWLGSLYFACPLVIMPPLTFLARPLRWLTAISRFGGTLAAAPNFAYELCLHRIEDSELQNLDLSSWRCAFNGAEAVSPATIQKFTKRFAKCGFRAKAVMPVYGLAESSVGLAFPPLDRLPRFDRIKRSVLMTDGRAIKTTEADHTDGLELPGCGFPLPGHQIRVVGKDDRELPDRQEGSLQFKGPSATRGYFRNPEQTAALFHGDWLDSGDRGYISDGEIFITGRSKDIIIKAGRNIYPVELEEAVGAIAGVRKGNVAVFGSLDQETGTEQLVILAETRMRKPESREKMRVDINTVTADLVGTAPDHVVLAVPNTVLKTSSGKIRRKASKGLYERGLVGKPARAVWLQLLVFSLANVKPQIKRAGRGLTALAYAVYSWLLFCLAAPVVSLAIGVLPTINSRWQFIRACLKLFLTLTGTPLTVAGRENLPDRDTPCILAANHASYLDSMILPLALARTFGFIAKGELRDNIFLRYLLPRLGIEFVERFNKQKGIEDSLQLTAVAEQGRSLIFFPEGTFMRMPGLLPFRMGAFETAAKAGLPIVPVAIRGSRSILRADSWFPRRGAVRVIIGEPLETREILERTGGDLWQTTVELRNRTRSWILAHSGEPDLEHERSPLLSGEQS
ncbi:MAG: AMP-binding protein [Thermodesulfobacteriota bacterium]